jgi:hypothetical protein
MGKGGPTYVDSQKVLDQFGKTALLVPGDGAYEVQTNRRVKDGNIEIHVKETDIFYIMDGSATFLMGGTAVDAHPGRPDRPLQLTAKEITNPEVRELKERIAGPTVFFELLPRIRLDQEWLDRYELDRGLRPDSQARQIRAEQGLWTDGCSKITHDSGELMPPSGPSGQGRITVTRMDGRRPGDYLRTVSGSLPG